MAPTLPTYQALEAAELMREIERYLAAVETFRREGCEPRWLDHCDTLWRR